MKTNSTRSQIKAIHPVVNETFEGFKIKLKRKQYIHNLLETNRRILLNNNINTLHLF